MFVRIQPDEPPVETSRSLMRAFPRLIHRTTRLSPAGSSRPIFDPRLEAPDAP